MGENEVADECVFCRVATGRAESSTVYEDEAVIAFMDVNPLTRGHVLVVPREHSAGFEDLDSAVGARVWSAGARLARAVRRSDLGCDGVNLLVCDGDAAFQTVLHFHLHVIPRYASDGVGQPFRVEPTQRARSLLDGDAHTVKAAIASLD